MSNQSNIVIKVGDIVVLKSDSDDLTWFDVNFCDVDMLVGLTLLKLGLA